MQTFPDSDASEVMIETVPFGRSSFETVTGAIEKAWNLKQNPRWYCFKAWTLVRFKGLFQKVDLDSGEFFEWGTD